MCSSQTGCTSYSPKVLVKSLSDEEVQQYLLQYRDSDGGNRSQETRGDEKPSLSTVRRTKRKLRNVQQLSVKSIDTNRSLSENSSLKSDGRLLRVKNLCTTTAEGTKNPAFNNSLCSTKLIKGKESSSKKYSLRYSRPTTKQNLNNKVQNKSVHICTNTKNSKNISNICSESLIKTKRYSTPPPIIQSCSNENESDSDSDDPKVTEEITRNIFQILPIKEEKNVDMTKRVLTRPKHTHNLINKNKTLTIKTKTRSASSENREKRNVANEDSDVANGDSESQSDVEATSIGLIKLKSPRSLGIVNQNEKDMIDCSETLKMVDSLMIDNSKVGKLCLSYHQYFNEYVKSLIRCLSKSLEAMLIDIARNDISKDFEEKHGNDRFDNFSSIEKMVVNELAQPIKHNVELSNFSCDDTSIEDVFVQPPLKENGEVKNSLGNGTAENIIQSTIQENVKLSDDKILIQKVLEYLSLNINQLDSKVFRPTLKIYSKDFVQTFTMILDKFDEDDKKKMIPIVYLYVFKYFENSSQSKQECLWNVILKLFEMENYSCEYDEVSFKPWKQMETVFSIYERWLNNSCSKSDLSREVINPNSEINSEGVRNESGNSPSKNKLLLDELSSVSLDRSETQENLAIDKDLDCDNSDLFEESVNKICIERTIAQIFELQINHTNKDCLNDWCEKKVIVPCFYCKTPVSCQDLCQVNDDQIFNAALSEKELVLVSCNLHKNMIKNYIFVEKLDSMLDCVNSFCSRKLSVPCIYCMELVACEHLCQVNEDQHIINIETEEYTWILISCKSHKDGPSKYNEVIKLEEHDMPYEPSCWRPNCDKRSLVVCVCKTRSYCSDTCQEEDWYSCHYKDCIRRPHPDLIL